MRTCPVLRMRAGAALLAGLVAACGGASAGNPGNDAGLPDAGLPDAGAMGVDDLSATLEPFRADGGMPGITGAVFRGGALIALGASGVRKQGDSTKVTTSDQWHLGSDTKAMTATLIGIFVDQGKLHFNDTIGQLFPGETIDPGYQSVTLQQLLEHRGGTPGNVPADIWAKMWSDGSSPTARSTAVHSLLGRAPEQAPGTYVYSNSGYIIAGAALERIAGDTWEHLIKAQLWTPLGMASCGFGPPGTPGAVAEPWGHLAGSNGVLTPYDPGTTGADNPPSLGPAGTAHCAIADWGKFLALHLAAARNEAPTLVTNATLQALQTPPSGGDYAAGWIVTSRPWAGGTALTHTGSNTLWFATAWLAPAKNLAFVVATNCATNAAATNVDAAFGPLIARYAP